jgi:hypothetical protein
MSSAVVQARDDGDKCGLTAAMRDGVNIAMKVGQRGEMPKCGTAQPTIFWNAGAATDPP